MQHSDDRITMESLNVSKMIWSIITSPTPFPAFGNLFKPLTHNSGNDMEKFREKPALLSPLETSLNPSPMHPSQTTSQARILHLSRRTTLALHMAMLPKPRNPLLILHQSSAKKGN